MKGYKKYTIVLLLALVNTSCIKSFLDRTPGVPLDDDKVFADPVQAARFADNAYNSLINDYVRFNSYRGSTSQASDEAVSGNSENTVTTLNRGLYHDHSTSASLNDIRDIWKRMYEGIAITNKMLDRMATVPVATIFPAQRIEGEMRFLRAFFYFELIKRFGGVPIVDKEYGVNDDVNFPRKSYDECVAFINADLDKAYNLLGNDADYGPSNYGRATKGATLALKGRVLLYAASKLNNPTNDKQKWKAAADVAKSIIDMGQYSLQATYDNILNVPTSTEYIMIKVRGPRAIDGMFADFAMSPGSGGAQGQMNPTQNHVDMYEAVKKDALGNITSAAAITDATSGYNPQAPYANRDPRFYANILYNTAPWQGKQIETWSQVVIPGPGQPPQTFYGKDYNIGITYTATRYYCKKYWPEVYVRLGGTSGTTLLNYIYFRYAEVLLNYAEALNEFENTPTTEIYNAVNQIRNRVGMPGLPAGLDQAKMREAIRHERAIELAFEDHRWYDIMRWKIGPDVVAKPMYGMNVVKNANGSFTYTPVLLGNNFQKTYLDYMHRYPIPKQEIYKSKGILVQNPGWE